MRLVLVITTLLLSTSAFAQEIEEWPGLWPLDVNARGDVVGRTAEFGGFLLTHKGELIPLNVPDATSTIAFGINAHGQVVGAFFLPGGQYQGFVWDQREGFRTINVPGCLRTLITAINARGRMAGVCGIANSWNASFIYDRGEFSIIKVQAGGEWHVPTGMSDSGIVVGVFGEDLLYGVYGSYVVDRRGGITFIRYPGAFQTEIHGIAAKGDMVGTSLTDTSRVNFIYRRGKFLDLPAETIPSGINASGTVVGFSLATGTGFVWERAKKHAR